MPGLFRGPGVGLEQKGPWDGRGDYKGRSAPSPKFTTLAPTGSLIKMGENLKCRKKQ